MTEQPYTGIMIGVVNSLEDEEGLGRVQVRYPCLEDQDSDWARLVSPMAGPERGIFFRPEVEDEVLIAFEQGDPRRPYVLGALWSSVDLPPPTEGSAKENNQRVIRSRCGHVILLDDKPGAEKIELIDKDEKRRVVIDSANSKIQVICESGDVEVTAESGKVTIKAQTVEIEASQNMTLKAGGSMNVEATGQMTIKGATVNIN
jgi:uncharacterized protein involved in type VI secretion and phage assembly